MRILAKFDSNPNPQSSLIDNIVSSKDEPSEDEQKPTQCNSRYLSPFQRKLLEKKLMKGALSEQSQKRIHIMLLADEGKSQAEICRTLGCCPATVRHWILVAKSGQAHICFDNPSGRPKAIDDSYINRLKELVEHSPREYGYAFRHWTAGWLGKHLEKEFNVRVSDRHISRLLKQMGLSTRSQTSCKTQRTPTDSQANQTAHQGSAMGTYSTQITIRDLQSASYPEPVTPMNLRDKQADFHPSQQGSNIYGAESASDFPFFTNTQSPFGNYYFRHSVANVS